MTRNLERTGTGRGRRVDVAEGERKVECQDGKKLILRGRGDGPQAESGKKQKRTREKAPSLAPLAEEKIEKVSAENVISALAELCGTLGVKNLSDRVAIELVDLIVQVPHETRDAVLEVIIDRFKEELSDALKQGKSDQYQEIPGCSIRNPTPTCDEYANSKARRPEGKRSMSLTPLNSPPGSACEE